jgi:signal transduction histidine kinase/ligand-binding sensor domain-containing protein
LAIRQWQTEDGLPQNSVTCLLQSRVGYIWFGTYAGLVRFDGVRFTVFDSERFPGLANNRITALHEDADQALWIGHETGDVTRFARGEMQVVKLPESLPRSEVMGLGAGPRGPAWLVNLAGWLVNLETGQMHRPPALTNAPNSYGLVTDAEGNAWCLRRGRLQQFSDTGVEDWIAPGEVTPQFVQALAPSRKGGVWVAISGKVRRLHQGRWVEEPPDQPWSADPIGCLAESRSGDIVVGTRESGLFISAPQGKAAHFSRTNGLGQDWVRSLVVDREGNIWAGLGNGGLTALRAVDFEAVNPPGKWHGRSVLAVLAARDGSLWAGTEGDGLYRWEEGGKWTRFGESEGLGSRFVWSLGETSAGEILAGTWNGGLFRKTGERFEPAIQPVNLNQPVTAIFTADSGETWIGTRTGVGRYEDGKMSWLTVSNNVRLADVRCMVRATDGAMWFGMNGGGLAMMQKDQQVQVFHRADGLSGDFINCLYLDATGALWCGTSGNGLTRYREGKFARVGFRQGLPSVNISHIQNDGQGNLWLGSAAGVLQVSESELNACADAKIERLNVSTYGLQDGLNTTECSSGFQPAGCQTGDGDIWFPTRKGLVRTNPKRPTTNDILPTVVIEHFRCQEAEMLGDVPQTERIVIPPGRSRFEFHFTALSFVAPEKVRFKYRLAGMESDWIEKSGERNVSYSYVPPGDYRFEVIAANDDGMWNNTGAQLAFTVQPFFWQTLWFRVTVYVASCLAVAGGVWLETRRRLRRKMENMERQRAVERERARIAKDIHDDLGASLTRITMLSHTARKELGDPELVGHNLARIDGTARELTRAMDEIVWAVNPRHDTLDSLAIYLVRFAQDFLAPAGIRCRVDMPVIMPQWPIRAELRHNVFLAFKEAINNVVRHARAREVRIALHPHDAGFTLSVGDDGIGFNQSEPAASQRSRSRVVGGNGLRNMQTRMNEIGASVVINSQPEGGTKVVFEVPIKVHAEL